MVAKKKISIMLIVIIIIQIILPVLTVAFESNFTLFSMAEEEINFWDISATEEDHVIATFDEKTETLTISGIGKMKNFSLIAPWNDIAIKKLIIKNGVENLGNNVCKNCTFLTSVEIADSIKDIENYAFYQCSSLKHIIIPKSVTSIESLAFGDCENLEKIVIPETTISIGNNAFWNCTKINIFTNNEYVQKYAQENNIKCVVDKKPPTILKVNGILKNCIGANGKITLTIEKATDEDGVGLAEKPYSFDNGTTWVAENTKTYTENTEGIKICVRDILGNTYSHETLNIRNIKDHKWGNGRVTREPTCSEKGTKMYICVYCDGVKIETIPTIEHNYIDGVCTECEAIQGENQSIGVTSNTYVIENKIISKIQPSTTLDNFIKNIKANGNITIKDGAGNFATNNTIITTGMKLEVDYKGKQKDYILIVLGDVDENGTADFWDMLKINQHRLKLKNLNSICKMAGDVDSDGNADFWDVLKINKYRLGLSEKL